MVNVKDLEMTYKKGIQGYKVTQSEGCGVVFEKEEVSNVQKEIINLKEKFGELAIDAATLVWENIKHEDNRMCYEIMFWKEVISELKK